MRGRRRTLLMTVCAASLAVILGAVALLYLDYRRYSAGRSSRVFERIYPKQHFHVAQTRLNDELVAFLRKQAGVRNTDVTEQKVNMSDGEGVYQKLHWRIAWRGGLSLTDLERHIESLSAHDGWRIATHRIESRQWGDYLYLELAIGRRISHSLLITLERRRLEPEEILGAAAAVAPGPAPRVAIVIDDVGYNLELAQDFLKLDAPLAYSVLPFLSASTDSAEMIHRAGREVMIHMPMEPRNYPDEDPGPGAILGDMDPEDVRGATLRAIDAVPFAVGLNNHMGSRITTDPILIGMVLRTAREKGLFFLDSRTTDKTIAYRMARRLGVRAASRQVFLDDVFDVFYVGKMLDELFAVARRDGQAIAIGHLNPATLEALRANLWKARRYGVEICPISRLIQ